MPDGIWVALLYSYGEQLDKAAALAEKEGRHEDANRFCENSRALFRLVDRLGGPNVQTQSSDVAEVLRVMERANIEARGPAPKLRNDEATSWAHDIVKASMPLLTTKPEEVQP